MIEERVHESDSTRFQMLPGLGLDHLAFHVNTQHITVAIFLSEAEAQNSGKRMLFVLF